ncbi:MAG: hypothetical protein ACHP9Z_26080 [Streptosporangiales bacterium]
MDRTAVAGNQISAVLRCAPPALTGNPVRNPPEGPAVLGPARADREPGA